MDNVQRTIQTILTHHHTIREPGFRLIKDYINTLDVPADAYVRPDRIPENDFCTKLDLNPVSPYIPPG